MVVLHGETLQGLMPDQFPNHPFPAVLQVGEIMMHATIRGEEVDPLTYAAELHDPQRYTDIGKVGTFHLHDLELSDVVIIPH